MTTAKIKKEAVTAAKVKKGTLTGTQINTATLGTVPTAQTANSVAPSENWHEVGAAGEPGFLNNWKNVQVPVYETAGFYKDHEGIVHLKGFVGGGSDEAIFLLPSGYRPATGKGMILPASCFSGTCTNSVTSASIVGPGAGAPGLDGAVQAPFTTAVSLNGITFRAES